MEQVRDRLRAAGLRITAPRVSVLGVLDASEDHPRVDQVIERVHAAGVSISTQATYDVCEALHRAGLARDGSRPPAARALRVARRRQPPPPRLSLVRRAVDVECVVGEAGCLEPSERDGFTIDEAEVTFWGLCPRCQNPTVEGTTHV